MSGQDQLRSDPSSTSKKLWKYPVSLANPFEEAVDVVQVLVKILVFVLRLFPLLVDVVKESHQGVVDQIKLSQPVDCD